MLSTSSIHDKNELLLKIIPVSNSSPVFRIFLLDNMLHGWGSVTPPWPRWAPRERRLGRVDKREWEATGAPHTRLDTFPPLGVCHPYPSSPLWRPHAHTFFFTHAAAARGLCPPKEGPKDTFTGKQRFSTQRTVKISVLKLYININNNNATVKRRILKMWIRIRKKWK